MKYFLTITLFALYFNATAQKINTSKLIDSSRFKDVVLNYFAANMPNNWRIDLDEKKIFLMVRRNAPVLGLHADSGKIEWLYFTFKKIVNHQVKQDDIVTEHSIFRTTHAPLVQNGNNAIKPSEVKEEIKQLVHLLFNKPFPVLDSNTTNAINQPVSIVGLLLADSISKTIYLYADNPKFKHTIFKLLPSKIMVPPNLIANEKGVLVQGILRAHPAKKENKLADFEVYDIEITKIKLHTKN
jgi:hypothetical protein